jgi:uncharacterized protein YjaG (DUF416 family)
MVLRYNEPELVEKLNRLPKPLRAAFAALSAERLLPAYVSFCKQTSRGDADELMSIQARLWQDLDGVGMTDEELHQKIDTCVALIPQEDDEPWVEQQPYAEDAAAAVAYALRARRSGESQEAAWAARRAYEALDHYVITTEQIDTNAPGAEGRIMAHPLVQAELARQRQDLEDLRMLAGPWDDGRKLMDLRRRAERDAGRFFVVG